MAGELIDAVDQMLELVSAVEESIKEKKPIAFDRKGVAVLRAGFEAAGINFDIENPEREGLQFRPKFRAKVGLSRDGKSEMVLVYDSEKPKGERWVEAKEAVPGLAANTDNDRTGSVRAMLGANKFNSLITWCYRATKEEGYPGRIGGHPGTEGRGLQQAAADLLAIAILDPDDEDFESRLQEAVGKLNRRLWKGFRKTVAGKEMVVVDVAFKRIAGEEPGRTLASFPPAALPGLIRFLSR